LNRRQKRKQFKKVFGMNPEQYEEWWAEHWPELLHERLREAQRAAGEGLKEFARQVHETALNMAADEESKMQIMWAILKVIGAGCLIVLAAIVLMILVACFVAIFRALTEKK